MIVSVPSCARGAEPVTGASSIASPCCSSAAPIDRVGVGPIVEQSMNSVPFRAPLAAPPSPSSTLSTCSPSTTIVITISHSEAAFAGVRPIAAPCSAANCSAFSPVRFQTVSSNPPLARFAAIREPMIPRPRNATRWLTTQTMPENRLPARSHGQSLLDQTAGESPSGRFSKPIAARRLAMTTTARSFDPQPLTGRQLAHRLRRQFLVVEQVSPGLAGVPSGGARRAVPTAFGDQRVVKRRERLELADHTVSAVVPPPPAGAAPERVLHRAQWELELERLDRGVERVAHRDVHAARAVRVRARALSAADRLVVGDLVVSQRQVVHRALPEGPPERREHDIGDPGGGLDVAAHHRGGRAGVEQATLWRPHLQWTVGAGVGGNIRIGQDANGEIAG